MSTTEFNLVAFGIAVSNNSDPDSDILQIAMKCGHAVFNEYVDPTKPIYMKQNGKRNRLVVQDFHVYKKGVMMPSQPRRIVLQRLLDFLKQFKQPSLLIGHGSCFNHADNLVRMILKESLETDFSNVILGFTNTREMFKKKFPERGSKFFTLDALAIEAQLNWSHSTHSGQCVKHNAELLEQLTLHYFAEKDFTIQKSFSKVVKRKIKYEQKAELRKSKEAEKLQQVQVMIEKLQEEDENQEASKKENVKPKREEAVKVSKKARKRDQKKETKKSESQVGSATEFNLVSFGVEVSDNLDPDSDILQIAMKCGHAVFNEYVDPTKPIYMKPNGKRNRLVVRGFLVYKKGAMMPSQPRRIVLQQLLDFLKQFKQPSLLIGHGSCFNHADNLVRIILKESMETEFSNVILGFTNTREMFKKKFPERGSKFFTLDSLAIEAQLNWSHSTHSGRCVHNAELLEQLTLHYFAEKDFTIQKSFSKVVKCQIKSEQIAELRKSNEAEKLQQVQVIIEKLREEDENQKASKEAEQTSCKEAEKLQQEQVMIEKLREEDENQKASKKAEQTSCKEAEKLQKEQDMIEKLQEEDENQEASKKENEKPKREEAVKVSKKARKRDQKKEAKKSESQVCLATKFNVVCFGIEVSGLFDPDSDILQIAMKCGDAIFNEYIDPTKAIQIKQDVKNHFAVRDWHIYKNGIMKPSRPQRIVLQRLLDFLKQFKQPSLLICHRVSFLYAAHLVRIILKESMETEFSNVILGFTDTYTMFKKKFPENESEFLTLHRLAAEARLKWSHSLHSGRCVKHNASVLDKLWVHHFAKEDFTIQKSFSETVQLKIKSDKKFEQKRDKEAEKLQKEQDKIEKVQEEDENQEASKNEKPKREEAVKVSKKTRKRDQKKETKAARLQSDSTSKKSESEVCSENCDNDTSNERPTMEEPEIEMLLELYGKL